MSEQKHTPGPLDVTRDSLSQAQWTVTKSHGHQPNSEQAGIGHVVAVARCYHEADARLYASAPDLLAACESAIAALTQPVQTSGNLNPSTCDILRADARFAVETLKSAITKAKGQP